MGKWLEQTFLQRKLEDREQRHENLPNITKKQRSANRNHNEILLHTYFFKENNRKICVGEHVEKLENLRIAGGNVKWFSCCANSMTAPQKFNRELPYDPAISLLANAHKIWLFEQIAVYQYSQQHHSQ